MSIQIKSADVQVIDQKVMECMDEIIEKNPTVEPHDIAIVLLGNNKINYNKDYSFINAECCQHWLRDLRKVEINIPERTW